MIGIFHPLLFEFGEPCLFGTLTGNLLEPRPFARFFPLHLPAGREQNGTDV